MDGGAWQAIVHGVTKSRTRLRDFTSSFPGIEGESEVAQSCPTLCNPMDCSSPGSSIHGIFQARVKSPTKDLQTFRLHLEKALTASEEPKDKLIRKIQVFLELTYVFCAITIRILTILTIDFPGGSDSKVSAEFSPWVGKISWRRK